MPFSRGRTRSKHQVRGAVEGPDGTPRGERDWTHESNRRHLLSPIRAIEDGTEPRDTTSVAEAVAVQEMLTGIYASHLTGVRLHFDYASAIAGNSRPRDSTTLCARLRKSSRICSLRRAFSANLR